MTEEATMPAVDKSTWGAGPWQNEPDKVQFITAAGLDGLIVRSPGGHLCGYVGVPPGHPMHGVDYDDVPGVDVHGGLTYADVCDGHICHVPEPGRPADVWWLGFDCAHLGDLSPVYALGSFRTSRPESYKPIEYVRREVERLATQLAAIQEAR